MDCFYLKLAGQELLCRVRYPETADYFTRFAPPSSVVTIPEGRRINEVLRPVMIPDADWREYLSMGMEDSPHTEYSMLTEYCADELAMRDRMILHASAIRWRDRAYLICADSGVGKSTQTKWLQELRPGEFSVICGDRPLLSFHDNEIMVHPSPWNGKENWHGADAAPLAGILLLERKDEDRLLTVPKEQAALQIYSHIIHSGWNPGVIRRIAGMATYMLNTVPVWKLCSANVPASTQLMIDELFCGGN